MSETQDWGPSVSPPMGYLGGIYGNTAGVEVVRTIPCAPGMRAILLVAGNFTLPQHISHIKVNGTGDGGARPYFETSSPNQPFYVVPIIQSQDQQVDVRITTTAAAPTAGFELKALFDPSMDLQAIWHSNPSPWQAADSIAPIDFNDATADTTIIAAPAAGLRIWIIQMVYTYLQQSGASWCIGQFQCGSVIISHVEANAPGPIPVSGGVPLPLAAALTYHHLFGPTGLKLNGHVAYAVRP